jgi:hypothetical protein
LRWIRAPSVQRVAVPRRRVPVLGGGAYEAIGWWTAGWAQQPIGRRGGAVSQAAWLVRTLRLARLAASTATAGRRAGCDQPPTTRDRHRRRGRRAPCVSRVGVARSRRCLCAARRALAQPACWLCMCCLLGRGADGRRLRRGRFPADEAGFLGGREVTRPSRCLFPRHRERGGASWAP